MKRQARQNTCILSAAAANPEKVKELSTLFAQEARKYQVLPLDASVATRFVVPRPNITADIDVPQGGAEGMLLTSGGRFAGYGFYLLKGKPVFLWNLADLKRVRWEGPDALAPGKHTVEFDFKYEGLGPETLAFNNRSGIGRSGTGAIKVDGKETANQKMERTLLIILQ